MGRESHHALIFGTISLRFLDLTLATIDANLALDEILLLEVEEGRGGPILRIWEPTHHAVVLGASGRIQDDVDLEACRHDGIPIARRSSGGGTVVVGPGAMNFTVVLPRDYAPGLEAVDFAQRFVLEQVAISLREFGEAVHVLGSGDLTVNSRKIAGSAQRRLKDHFLVHATILHDFPLDRIDRYLRAPKRQPSYRQDRPHHEFVANLSLSRSQLREAIQRAWRPLEDVTRTYFVDGPAIERSMREKFSDPAWISRFSSPENRLE